jgi:hypothetical protein
MMLIPLKTPAALYQYLNGGLINIYVQINKKIRNHCKKTLEAILLKEHLNQIELLKTTQTQKHDYKTKSQCFFKENSDVP